MRTRTRRSSALSAMIGAATSPTNEAGWKRGTVPLRPASKGRHLVPLSVCTDDVVQLVRIRGVVVGLLLARLISDVEPRLLAHGAVRRNPAPGHVFDQDAISREIGSQRAIVDER